MKKTSILVFILFLTGIMQAQDRHATQTWKSSSGKYQKTTNLCLGKWIESDDCRRSQITSSYL